MSFKGIMNNNIEINFHEYRKIDIGRVFKTTCTTYIHFFVYII